MHVTSTTTISTTIDGEAASITPHGEIDAEFLPRLYATAHALPDTVTRLTWDLGDTSFMDVSGLHLMCEQREDARRGGRAVAFTGLYEQPLRLLKLAADLFPAMAWEDFLPAAPAH
ncbi:hypothetical protein C6N75_27415 [Streptomyces solincola]|uniref:STAS domain-containing protein n=1 Tax=Streptomyces solincola TaxID=2100817 RepID=A0A2S9PNW9_9ACTN|nr:MULTISPECIES: STAS domain-containing protein [Streptomyces]PRH76102.1 hypothetical protein C6N75_27415 [Streptomyces solincola]